MSLRALQNQDVLTSHLFAVRPFKVKIDLFFGVYPTFSCV
jgi:hypothetical protein